MIFEGYNQNKLKTYVYSDVAISLDHWATKENIDLYVLSNGWSYAMRKILSKTNHSNLTRVIKDFFDTTGGPLDQVDSYKRLLLNKFNHIPPEDILFLTHWGAEGVAAHQAGLSVVLVTTHLKDLLRERNHVTRLCGLPYVRSFNELLFTQDSLPASMLGVDVGNGIKDGQPCCSNSNSSASSLCLLQHMQTFKTISSPDNTYPMTPNGHHAHQSKTTCLVRHNNCSNSLDHDDKRCCLQ